MIVLLFHPSYSSNVRNRIKSRTHDCRSEPTPTGTSCIPNDKLIDNQNTSNAPIRLSESLPDTENWPTWLHSAVQKLETMIDMENWRAMLKMWLTLERRLGYVAGGQVRRGSTKYRYET